MKILTICGDSYASVTYYSPRHRRKAGFSTGRDDYSAQKRETPDEFKAKALIYGFNTVQGRNFGKRRTRNYLRLRRDGNFVPQGGGVGFRGLTIVFVARYLRLGCLIPLRTRNAGNDE